MKANYGFSTSIRNPYAAKLKKQITIRLDSDTIDYFKNEAKATGVTYQNLINLYLRDCAVQERKIKISWN